MVNSHAERSRVRIYPDCCHAPALLMQLGPYVVNNSRHFTGSMGHSGAARVQTRCAYWINNMQYSVSGEKAVR